MTARKLLKQIGDAHREQTKNFGWFMTTLWAIISWSMLLIMLIIIGIAWLNPLWFRERLLQFVVYTIPEYLNRFRTSLFKNYSDKVNLFDTLKNVK